MDPIPLFTKANDGCRPFVEVYSGNNLVASTIKDYSAMTLFTPYDGEIVLKMSVAVAGDVTILAYHARQSIGTFFAGKVEKVPICRVYFNPAYLSATSKSHIRFRTHELDFLGEAEKVPQGFALSVNFGLKDKRATNYPYKMPEKKRMELLFSSKSEYEEAVESVGSTRPSPTSEAQPEMPPERPPREKKHEAIAKEMPKPASMADMATLRDAHHVSGLLKEQHKPSSLVDLSEHSAAENHSVIVGDLLGGSHPKEPVKSDVSVNAVADQNPSPLLDFAVPSSFPAPSNAESSGFGSRDNAFSGAAFGMTAQVDDAFLIDIGGASSSSAQQMAPESQSGLFDFSAGAADLLAPTSASQPQPKLSNDDLFGNVVPPTGAGFSKRSDSERMIDEMLSRLGTGETKPAPSQPQAPKPQPQPHSSKPNYNSSFFQAPGAGAGGCPKMTKNSFGDLLGGFTPLSTETKTIGEMKKAEEKRNMTPEEARVFEWTHGKSRNLRALLCSLDTVIWEGSRWEKCGMHNLVTFNDVKKMYRKACLAVHPDKQTGTANENLSKIIFTELNDGWSKFQEDEQAS
jgi:cyclin G-associated kinase